MKQLSLITSTNRKFYGGTLVQGRRKQSRPLCSRSPIHLTIKCKKPINLFNRRRSISSLIKKYSLQFGIKVFATSIQMDHIHIIIQIHDRDQYTRFIRTLTGIMARQYGSGLFQCLPFTRVGSWGRDYETMKAYLIKNDFEVWGLQAYKPRKDYYRRYRG